MLTTLSKILLRRFLPENEKKQGEKYVSVIIACAGNGTRMGCEISKVLLPILGKEAIYYTIKAFEDTDVIDEIVLVAREKDSHMIANVIEKYGFKKVKCIVKGGETRGESVRNGIMAVSSITTHIAVHDGARCLISKEEIKNVVHSAFLTDGATLATAVTDTIKKVDQGNIIVENVDRSSLRAVQTPQVFLLSKYKKALENLLDIGENITDDCMIMENAGYPVSVVIGSRENI
ncbi:MAG: 2-C-methyl-D-erythritol 4-phosphate cytidylyltransferase, partial [Acutalibacteraceae bacterium]